MFVRIQYFAKNECSCSFVFANMRIKLEHVRVHSVFVCLPTLKYEGNKGCINSFVVIGNLECTSGFRVRFKVDGHER